VTDIIAHKAAMRRQIMTARDALTPEARAAAAEALVGRAMAADFQALLPPMGGIITGYLPIRSEIDPQPLMQHLAQAGHRLALPRITPEGIVFHLWEAGPLVPGPFKVLEPPAEWPIAEPALFLVPLLAFDAAGHRLGYGRAYYDRAFRAHPVAKRVGLAFAMQEVPEVPVEPHDARLDLVLTEG
jgi:5-formyltetrahydrofolate cyclo-ligase